MTKGTLPKHLKLQVPISLFADPKNALQGFIYISSFYGTKSQNFSLLLVRKKGSSFTNPAWKFLLKVPYRRKYSKVRG